MRCTATFPVHYSLRPFSYALRPLALPSAVRAKISRARRAATFCVSCLAAPPPVRRSGPTGSKARIVLSLCTLVLHCDPEELLVLHGPLCEATLQLYSIPLGPLAADHTRGMRPVHVSGASDAWQLTSGDDDADVELAWEDGEDKEEGREGKDEARGLPGMEGAS